MASWMIYTVALGALVWLGALNLERVAIANGFPRRGVWGASLAIACVWPTLSALLRFARPATLARTIASPFTIVVGIPSSASVTPPPSALPSITSLNAGPHFSIDRALVVTWALLSILCILRLAFAFIALRRRKGNWRLHRVDEVDVRIAAHDGPAVVGLRRMDVVLPEWVLSLDEAERAMVLCHENEHRRAFDPQLLFAATLLVAIMPWNIALWLMMRRVRLAVEMDCDARVLRRHPTPRTYGLLMLAVAARRSPRMMFAAPTMADPVTHLERRITAMQSPVLHRRRTTYAAGALALATFALAAALRPAGAQTPTSASASQNDDRAALDAFMKQHGFGSWTHAHAQRGNTPPRYPDALRQTRTAGIVLAQFVVDTAGAVDHSNAIQVLSSTNEQFATAVRQTLPSMRFVSAEVDGHKVKQVVQVPFVFELDGSDAQRIDSSAHRTIACGQGACPVLRLQEVVVTAR
ncbi:MAG TPA: M56 family metallopeptidase [Gemmatimonadaceae bacterium]|jgi:TonB family protein